MSEEKKNPLAGNKGENTEDSDKYLDLDDTEIISHPLASVKKSKVSKLIQMSLHDNSPDVGGNYWLTCPWCGEDKLNFHVKRWVFHCYSCDRGRGMNLSDLFKKMGIE